jgi:hypothetical protein
LKYLLTAFLFLSPTLSWAAFPYDSVCEILVEDGNYWAGGSATLIAVSDSKALLLTCKHVAQEPGNEVLINWASTGEQSVGRVIAVGTKQDIAMVICPRPIGLRPVPIAQADMEETGKITNVGYPGITGTLEWQTGLLNWVSEYEIDYSCRPIPGMSGGATFDQYGNICGVITHFRPRSGGSASGVKMIEFIRYVKAHYEPSKKVTWETPKPETEKLLGTGEPYTELIMPENPLDFCDELEKRLAIPSTSPLVTQFQPEVTDTPQEEPTAKAPAPRKTYKPRPNKRRRLFGRSSIRRRSFR